MTGDQDLLTRASTIVGDEFGVSPEKITARRKGHPTTAFARQVLAYLLHTEASHDKQKIGKMLQRHRSTIGHAIEVIEERRDTGALGVTLDALAARFRELLPAKTPEIVVPGQKLSDSFARSLTAALTEGGLYGAGDSVEIERSDDRVTIHVMLKARGILAQTQETDRVALTRKVLAEMAAAAGWVQRFSDALWCERGTKGWRVVGKFTNRQR